MVLETMLALALLAPQAPPANGGTPKVEAAKVETPAPVLASDDALKLTNYLLTSENLHLKIQALQADLAKMQTDVQAFVRGLDRPGFHLERDPKGGWIYVANPPEKPPEKK